MTKYMLENLKKICLDIHANTPATGKWMWDEEFKMICNVLHANINAFSLLSIISMKFDQQMDFEILSGRSIPIEKLIVSKFGIVPGQIFFTHDEGTGFILLAAWWPWGDSKNVSLRIGLFNIEEPNIFLSNTNAKDLLSEWFDLS